MTEYGSHYGKTDLERYGLFAEMQYLHGRGYTAPITAPQIRDPKGRQLYPGFPKWKTGLQDCYFDQYLKRLFIGEAMTNTFKRELKERNESNKLNRAKFRPTSKTHLHSTPGDYFGCFTERMPAMDPRPRKKEPPSEKDKAAEKKVFRPTNPGKKGGYGYTDTTFDRFPRYISTPYEPKPPVDPKTGEKEKLRPWRPPDPGRYFTEDPYKKEARFWVTYINTYPAKWSLFGSFKPSGPGKKLGGCMDGCFEQWPKYGHTPYIDQYKLEKYQEKMMAQKEGKQEEKSKAKFFPPPRNKTFATTSIVNMKAGLATNNRTWKTMQPVTYSREFI